MDCACFLIILIILTANLNHDYKICKIFNGCGVKSV